MGRFMGLRSRTFGLVPTVSRQVNRIWRIAVRRRPFLQSRWRGWRRWGRRGSGRGNGRCGIGSAAPRDVRPGRPAEADAAEDTDTAIGPSSCGPKSALGASIASGGGGIGTKTGALANSPIGCAAGSSPRDGTRRRSPPPLQRSQAHLSRRRHRMLGECCARFRPLFVRQGLPYPWSTQNPRDLPTRTAAIEVRSPTCLLLGESPMFCRPKRASPGARKPLGLSTTPPPTGSAPLNPSRGSERRLPRGLLGRPGARRESPEAAGLQP